MSLGVKSTEHQSTGNLPLWVYMPAMDWSLQWDKKCRPSTDIEIKETTGMPDR